MRLNKNQNKKVSYWRSRKIDNLNIPNSVKQSLRNEVININFSLCRRIIKQINKGVNEN